MNKLLIILVAVFVLKQAHADCGSGNVSFWPQNGNLQSGQAIIITGSGYLQKFIDSIGTKYNVSLLSNDQKIRMKVAETHQSLRGETQVILFPMDSLVIGEEYQLIYDPLEKDIPFKRYNYAKRSYENILWKIVKHTTNVKSFNWTKLPKTLEVEYFEMGCGPIIYQIFNLGISDTNTILIRATLLNKSTQAGSTYIVQASEGTVYIGHSMCGGEFKIEIDKMYSITFEYLDLFSLKPLSKSKSMDFTVRKPLE